jgi:hypothetical protein
MLSRREFLSSLSTAAVFPRFSAVRQPAGLSSSFLRSSFPDPLIGWRGESAASMGLRAGTLLQDRPRQRRNPHPPVDWTTIGPRLRKAYPDLRRHFVFEYYPWYGTNPWRHWNLWDRQPPSDIAATSVPLLGPYDSRSTSVIEQHARWIADSGVGAINISWWGQGSFEDQAVPLIMDVMHDHDIHVTFHLEPYRTNRVTSYADDIEYLLRQYGDKRRWDCFLLLENASGKVGPVFKSFRTMVPRTSTDCHGVVSAIPDYVPDSTWRRQTDALRTTLRSEFDYIMLLADVSDIGRMAAAGFDGMAIYDNFVVPDTWPELARQCSSRDLVYSFNVNAGFDGIALRHVDPGSCYTPTPVTPAGTYDWSQAADRDRAAREALRRMEDSFRTTVQVQTADALEDVRRGFFLVYVGTFNEWHEGTQFEPMKDFADLPPDQRALGYHNPTVGTTRLSKLKELLALVLESAD